MTAVTIYGLCAVTFMMLMYALERRGARFVAAFAVGCLLSSAYGFWSGAWPFGVAEAVWSLVALRRFQTVRTAARSPAVPSEPAARPEARPGPHPGPGPEPRPGP
jgi:hypothetical protein